MSDANCNCCGCQYSTPPWWVTMGFNPPNNNQPVHVQQPGSPTPVAQPSGVTVPPPPSNSFTNRNPAGSVFSSVAGAASAAGAHGNNFGSGIPNPITAATSIVGNVVNGLGGLIGKLF